MTEIRDYLSKFQGTGDFRFHSEQAVEILKKRRKELEQKEKDILLEKEKLEREIALKIRHEEEEIENIQRKLKEKPSGDAPVREVRENGKGKSLLFAALFITGAALGALVWKNLLMAILTSAFAVWCVILRCTACCYKKKKQEQRTEKKVKTRNGKWLLDGKSSGKADEA